MQIHLSPRNLTLTGAIHSHAAEKIEHLEVLCQDIIAAHIVLVHDDAAKPSARYGVKVHLAVSGPDIHAEDFDADLYAAMDKVASKLARQLRKRKTRLSDKRRSVAQRAKEKRKTKG